MLRHQRTHQPASIRARLIALGREAGRFDGDGASSDLAAAIDVDDACARRLKLEAAPHSSMSQGWTDHIHHVSKHRRQRRECAGASRVFSVTTALRGVDTAGRDPAETVR